MYVSKLRLSHIHTPVSLLGRKVELSVHRDLTARWPHYYSEPAVRRRVVLCSQYSSPPALVDDVHEWRGCGVGSSFPWNPPPPALAAATHIYTHTLTSSWEIGGLCFLSGCPQPQTPGASRLVGILSSHSTDAPLPTDEKENKTWGRHCCSSSAIVSHIVFAISLLRPRPLLFFSFFCPGDR